MSPRVGIVVHGADAVLSDALVGAVATADGLGEVRAVEVVRRDESVAPAAARLAEVAEVVVGLGALPFPGLAARHDATRDALGGLPYWAVETWHGLPAFHDALAAVLGDAIGDARGADTTGPHVLLTAPDDVLRALPPEHRVVLRDVAAALHERTGRRPTIAVDRSPAVGAVTPAAAEVVGTLVEAHGATSVVRCSLVPGDGPDDAVTAAAARVGVRLRDVAIDEATHVRLLLEAVTTVLRQAVGGAGASPDADRSEEVGPSDPAAGTSAGSAR